MRKKVDDDRKAKEGIEGLRDTYYRKKEIRGLRMSQLGEDQDLEMLAEEIEQKIIEVLLKDVMPTLSEIEGTALKRFVTQYGFYRNQNTEFNERNDEFALEYEKLLQEHQQLQEDSEELKHNNVKYKSDLAILAEKLRHLEDQDESFRNVRYHIQLTLIIKSIRMTARNQQRQITLKNVDSEIITSSSNPSQ